MKYSLQLNYLLIVLAISETRSIPLFAAGLAPAAFNAALVLVLVSVEVVGAYCLFCALMFCY